MENLRILHIINVPWFNAVAWYGVNTALSQHLLGHEVYVAGDPGSPSLKRATELGLINILALPFSRPNPLTQLLSAFRLKRYIEKHGIGIVNAHQGNGFYMIALAARLAKNRPLLVRTRGDIRFPKQNIFNRLLYTRLSHGIIATSQVTYKRMIEIFPIGEGNIITILPGVDEKEFSLGVRNPAELKQRLQVPPEAFLFGLVGRLDKKKGHWIALSALKQLTEKGFNIHYVIAGPEQDVTYDELKTLSRIWGLAARVHFLGRVPDVRDVMAACDCGIIPSTESEAICRVGLEFMALGVPIIASYLHGIPDIVKDGVSGLLFKTGDANDLAGRIEHFLAIREFWPKLRESARQTVEERHSLCGLGQKSVAFYFSLMERKRS